MSVSNSFEILDKIEEFQEQLEFLRDELESATTYREKEHFVDEISFLKSKINRLREQLKDYEQDNFDSWYSTQDMRMKEVGMSYKDFL